MDKSSLTFNAWDMIVIYVNILNSVVALIK